MRTYSGHRGSVTSVAFSSDGTLALSSSADKSVQIWDPKELTKARFLFKPKPLHTLPADSIITSAAFDLGAKRVVASLDANKALLWTISGKWAPITLPMNGPVKRAVFSRDGGKALAVDSGGCSVAVWEASTGKRLWQNQHNAPVFQAIFDHEGKLVASTSADQTVKIWRSDGGTAVATLAGHQGEVRHVAAHPTKNIWLTGSSDTTAKLWFEGETKARHTLLGHSRRITSVAFNKDGTQFATGSYDGTVRLYDLKPDSGSQIDSESTGWSLYGWLDTTSKDRPRLRAQSFNPKSGDRTTIPMVGLEAEAEAIMNIRREVKRGDSGRWDQGEATGVLREKESVKVLEVLWDKEMKLQPQAVWIRFKRL
ncbi:MAG: WD40 repeat domain-containing protein [Verrucomicrobia bacterium]|nr:WD40 repeat domain-containing protein [Verrucomicrobiota bacterium]